MTLPRRVVPNTTYLTNRRCLDRRFYLQPSRRLTQIYLYALAYAQQKHGVRVHAFVCMSNHSHEVVTDVHGVLPDFLRDLRREVALGAKELYRIPENVWSAGKPSAVELHGRGAQLQEVLYTLLNPAAAGLVAHASEWPGAISLPRVRTIEVRRPDVWFGDGRPEVLTLELSPPPAWAGTEEAWQKWVAGRLAHEEDSIRHARARNGLRVLGIHKIMRQRPFDRPRNGDILLPSRHPTIATGGDAKLMAFVIGVLREWRAAYRAARERWRVDKDAALPLGTWWVVQRAGAVLA
jgi:putative transposase